MRVSAAAWDDPSVDWSQFAAVVIRSTWNYHHKPSDYAQWLRSVHASGPALWNPVDAVLGNMHKRYLTDWAARGAAVVASHYVPVASHEPLPQLLDDRGWDDVVIKPAISASAHGLWRTSRATVHADQARFAAQCRTVDLLVQPYRPEIASQGEWSLVFFANAFSHAVLKRPARGDFRVQSDHGGESASHAPHSALVDEARAFLSLIDAPLLYARVDGLIVDGRFVLMELEINEPCLFLGHAAEAPSRFAHAIMATL